MPVVGDVVQPAVAAEADAAGRRAISTVSVQTLGFSES
jgi:hypothetical protein